MNPTLATLGKPFSREFLFYPARSLSKPVGSGLCVAREPRLPRTSVAFEVRDTANRALARATIASVVAQDFGPAHIDQSLARDADRVKRKYIKRMKPRRRRGTEMIQFVRQRDQSTCVCIEEADDTAPTIICAPV